MKQIHTQMKGREPERANEAPDLPSAYDDGVSLGEKNTLEIQLEPRIKEWTSIPRNGPKIPMLGTILVIATAILLFAWCITGFIWLLSTGSTKILELSSILVGALVAALGYKQAEMYRGRSGDHRFRHPLPNDTDTNSSHME